MNSSSLPPPRIKESVKLIFQSSNISETKKNIIALKDKDICFMGKGLSKE